MKRGLAVAATIGLVFGLSFAGVSAASATECVPSPERTDIVVDTPASVIHHDAVVETFTTVHHDATYQRYSWKGGPKNEDPTTVPPADGWQANTSNYKDGDPVGEPFKRGGGKGDWFYWTGDPAFDEQVGNGDGVDAWDEPVAAVTHTVITPAVVCEQPVPFTPHNESVRWVLPASWPSTQTPTYQPSIFPQDRLVGDLLCGRWSQDDVYLIENPAEQVIFDNLGDVLTKDEDSAIYKSHVFTYGGDCVEPEPEPEPTETPTPTETPVPVVVEQPAPPVQPETVVAKVTTPALASTGVNDQLLRNAAGFALGFILTGAILFIIRRRRSKNGIN